MGPYTPCHNPCDRALDRGVPLYFESCINSRKKYRSINVNHVLRDLETALTTVGETSMVPSQDHTTTSSGAGERPLCGTCGSDFGRPQDVRRHVKEKHMPQRLCPFCPYEWSRPEKIKAHLTKAHRDELSTEILQGVCALRGQNLVVFLDAYGLLLVPGLVLQTYASSTPHSPSQS